MRIQAFFLTLGILTASASVHADRYPGRALSLHRDSGYEQILRYQAGLDKALTPARAIRWLLGAMGHPVQSAPSPVEFRPIVNTDDHVTRIIAALAYKFD